MMYRDEFWLARLGTANLPADETLEELAQAVLSVLTRKRSDGVAEEKDRVRRFCNFWGVTKEWLAFWERLYSELVETGEEQKLLDFLEQPRQQFRYELDKTEIAATSA